MKYKIQITSAFNRVGFSPRPGQVEIIDKILTSFLDNGKENVILSAPTGAGKSIIGLITAECITEILGTNKTSSIILSNSNLLNKQYNDSFKNIGSEQDFLMIKGANNYDCSALSTGPVKEKADACAKSLFTANQGTFGFTNVNHCNECDFSKMRTNKKFARHISTNYSYYFIDRMFSSNPLDPRDVVIWDEAHLVNDLFSDHNAIFFSEKRLEMFAEEVQKHVQLVDPLDTISTFKKAAKACSSGVITEKNFKSVIKLLHSHYSLIKDKCVEQAENAIKNKSNGEYIKMKRLSQKYEGLACKIGDFFTYNYEYVFEYKSEDHSISIKPIFVGDMFSVLKNSPKNLFMSATISDSLLYETLNLDRKSTAFIKCEPVFPPENKKIVFFNTQPLNYTTLKNRDVIDELVSSISKIVNHHTKKGESGIILTPSFHLQSIISGAIKSSSFKMFEQKRGDKLEAVTTQFKNSGSPSILISPSLFEGVDLPGDTSRFQIIVKAPYPSLGDKRMKHIADYHGNVYRTTTLMKIIQGAGRSIRSADDYATTYILDSAAEKLFTGNLNVWKNEFSVRST